FTPFLARALATRPSSPGRCVKGTEKSRMMPSTKIVASDQWLKERILSLLATDHWPLVFGFWFSDFGFRVGIDQANPPRTTQESHQPRNQGGGLRHRFSVVVAGGKGDAVDGPAAVPETVAGRRICFLPVRHCRSFVLVRRMR